MKRIAIIGGGISGLAAAWQLGQLQAAGTPLEFTLFEASARLGGIVETQRRDGFVIECGPDAWLSEKPWARELAVELGLEAEILASNDDARRTYILRDGSLVPIPDGMRMMVPTDLGAIAESPLFSPNARRDYAAEPSRAGELKAAALPENHDEPVADFVRRHFGEEVTRTVAGPLLAGVFGGDVERLSVRAVMAPFVKMEREHGSLITALQQRVAAHGNRSSVFTTLRSGLGTLVDRMIAALPGGSVRHKTRVIGVTQTGTGWEITAAGGVESFNAVIFATPAHVTRDLLGSLDSSAADQLPVHASSAVVVALAFDREVSREIEMPPGFGYLVPPQDAGEESLLACTFVNQKFPCRAPEGCVLLRAFFGAAAAARLMNHPDDELAARAREQLSIALGAIPPASFAVVRRWPQSLPQYEVGHLDRMRRMEERVRRFENLRLIGNAYHGVGLPDLIRQGRAAAHELVG